MLVIGAGAGAGAQQRRRHAFAVDALRHLVQSGARPRAAASVVAALTGTRANDLYTAADGPGTARGRLVRSAKARRSAWSRSATEKLVRADRV